MSAPKLIAGLPGRAAVLLAAAFILYWAGSRSLANSVADASPALALRLAPNNAVALENLANQHATEGVRTRRFGDSVVLAKAAILRSAASVAAFRVLGLLADVERQPARADALMGYADRLSRRDLGVRLYLLERAVSRNDADGALRHYDIALRTSHSSFDILAPVLSSALANRGVLDPITRAFAADPPWLPAFLEFAIPNTPAPRNLASVMVRTRGTTAMSNDPPIRQMLDRLVNDGHYADARRFLSLIRPGERPRGELIRNGHFADPDNFPPFAWAYVDDLDLGSAPQPGDGGLHYFARTDQSGPVAKQLLTLPGGVYRLSSVSSKTTSDPLGILQWRLHCAEAPSTALASLDFPQGSFNRSRGDVQFRVPATGCTGQWLELQVRAGDDPAGVDGYVHQVSIAPVRPTDQ